MPGRMQVQTQACDAFQESIRLHSTPTLRKAIILQVIPGLGIECSIE